MNTERLLTAPEADRLRALCNFTEQERQVFDLRVRDKSIVEISMALHMTTWTVSRRIKAMRLKIEKINSMAKPRTE